MLNLEQNDNYVLSIDGGGFESGEVVNCISYNKVKGKVVYKIMLKIILPQQTLYHIF